MTDRGGDPGCGEPRPEWAQNCCVICPAQKLGPGGFDVVDRPDVRYAYSDEAGCRIDLVTGAPVCVHPFRVKLDPAAYASRAAGWEDGAQKPDPDDPAVAARARRRPRRVDATFVPSPEHLMLPESVDDLEGWLVAMLRTAPHNAMASALEQAEAIASRRFSGEQVVAAVRRVLSHELTS